MKYFAADPHFDREGHSVLRRPFKNALEMSEYLVDKINGRVQRDDTLYILGDFAFNKKETSYWRQRINCKEIFITQGNHDISIANLQDIFGRCFVDKILETKILDLDLVLCHYPMIYWNYSHHNSGMLHGHLHDQRTETYLKAFPDMKILDVAFESAKKLLGDFIPFSEVEIYEYMKSQKGHDPLEFYLNMDGPYKKNHV